MKALFGCDQCTYQEWREEDDDVHLCPVCGNTRWQILKDPESDLDMTAPEHAADTADGTA